jgi:hypothetical protein
MNNNNTLPAKMVVFETPQSDRILEDTGLSKKQLKDAFTSTFFGNKGKYKDPMLNFQDALNLKSKSFKIISLSDAQHLANVMVHFGSKAVIGSDRCQFDGKNVAVSAVAGIIAQKEEQKKSGLLVKREEVLAELAQLDQELGLYDNEIGLTE